MHDHTQGRPLLLQFFPMLDYRNRTVNVELMLHVITLQDFWWRA
jgi:hypothetical protein